MKKFPLFLVVMFFVSGLPLSCKKNFCPDEAFMGTGTITGLDPRNCAACCGGLLVNFEGRSNSFEGHYYLVENAPSELGIDPLTANFPIKMKMEWVVLDRCNSGIIKVTRFAP